MPTTAPRQAQRESVVPEAIRRRMVTPQEKRESIVDNAVAKVLTSQIAPEEKRSTIAKSIAFVSEVPKAEMQQFESFLEYMQEKRLEMQQELIRLTDVEVMGELKSILDDLNRELNAWNDEMKPHTDRLDAIYALRSNNATEAAYREIQSDKKRSDEMGIRRTELTGKFHDMERAVSTLQRANAELAEEKSFFGFGGTTKPAREQIAANDLTMQGYQAKLSGLADEIDALDKEPAAASALSPELIEAKSKLAELLNISKPEHQAAQERLVQRTLSLLQTFKDRTGAGREHLAKMEKQYDRLKTANRDMSHVAAILDDAVAEAETISQDSRRTFEAPKEGETSIGKMQREEGKLEAESHIKTLAAKKREVVDTAAGLTSGAIKINTSIESLDNTTEMVRSMHTRGAASAAESLNVILQGIGMAALNEAAQAGKQALVRINEDTNRIAQKEVMRAAMDTANLGSDIQETINQLASYGDVFRAASTVTREEMAKVNAGLTELRAIKEGIEAEIKQASSDQADVGIGDSSRPREKSGAGVPGPFGEIG